MTQVKLLVLIIECMNHSFCITVNNIIIPLSDYAITIMLNFKFSLSAKTDINFHETDVSNKL